MSPDGGSLWRALPTSTGRKKGKKKKKKVRAGRSVKGASAFAAQHFCDRIQRRKKKVKKQPRLYGCAFSSSNFWLVTSFRVTRKKKEGGEGRGGRRAFGIHRKRKKGGGKKGREDRPKCKPITGNLRLHGGSIAGRGKESRSRT